MKNKIIVLLAARMGSSRFPGKTLADLHGKPMLERMLERIKNAKNINNIVLATTDLPEDDTLELWTKNVGIECYRGSSKDVLGRLKNAAQQYSASVVVEMLGDNPLVHSSIIDECLLEFEKSKVDYLATVTKEYPYADKKLRKFLIGIRVQVFSYYTLLKCEELAKKKQYREHATSFIAEHPEIFKTKFVEAKGKFNVLNRPELTFAVNYKENLDLIREIYKVCFELDNNFSIENAIKAFDSNIRLNSLMYPKGE